MLRRLLPCALLLVLLTGCVEQTQIITLNPDGRGKIEYEIRGPAQSAVNAGAGGKEKSVAELLNEAVARELTKPGIAAWKGVSAKWAPDGKLIFKGTAYFNRIEDLRPKQGKNELNFENFDLVISKDKGFKLTLHKNPPDKKKPAPDFSKMTDKEMDEYVLKQRIQYQSSKGILIAMFTDLNIKTEIRLPGEAKELKGFKKKGASVVTRELDGATVITAMNKFMAQDDAALKKWFKTAKSPDTEVPYVAELLEQASLTVPTLGAALFDYEKELRDALAVQAALRQQYNIPAHMKLPGE